MKKRLVCSAAILLFGGLGASADAALISVNFEGGQSGTSAADLTKGGALVTGTAGLTSDGNWNNEAASQQLVAVSVHDSLGAAAASLTYNAPNNWAATVTAPGGGTNADLMSGYLDNFQSSGTITITGLGTAFTTGGYQVLVYQNADSAGSFGFTATDNAGHVVTAYGQQTGAAGSNYPLSGGTAVNGFISSTSTNPAGPGSAANVVILKGLTGSNVAITGLTGTTGDGRARPNGFQIVSVPEPATLGVIGSLATIGLLARRRNAAHPRPV